MGIINLLLAILAFGFLIGVHEFGHFIAAKRSGIQVNEFWIGMGPTLLSKEWHGTKYCLRLLPLGGACVMEGEDGESQGEDAPAAAIGRRGKSFQEVSMPRRVLTVAAGALMNFAAGFLIILAVLSAQQGDSFVTTRLEGFFEGFQYQGERMLMPGDQILKVDGYRTYLVEDVTTGFSRGAADGKFDILVRRDGQKVLLKDLPLTRDFTDEYGNKLYGLNFALEPRNAGSLIKNSFYNAVNFGRLVWDSLGMLISGQVGMDQLSGPVGVASVMAETAGISLMSFFWLVAFISINLGVMNLLPLPALDGGRLVFLLIEAIRGKPVPPKYEGYVHAGGLALLMALMLYVTGQDIWNLISRAMQGM